MAVGVAPESEAAVAGGDDRRVVVAAHDREGDEDGIGRHQQGLAQQQAQHRQRQAGQLPKAHGHQGQRQEQRQRDVAQHRDGALEHGVLAGRGQAVAQHHAHEQHADEGGQLQEGAGQCARDVLAGQQADRDQRQRFNQRGRRDQADFRRMLEKGGLLIRRAGRARRLAHLGQQVARHRPADHAAEHQAERGRGNGDLFGARQVVTLDEHRTPCGAGAVPARQRDRPGQQADQR
jgi:hypothetical protein